MTNSIEQRVAECFKDYEYCWKLGEYHPAVKSLAEVYGAMPDLPPPIRAACEKRLAEIEIPQNVGLLVQSQLHEAIEHVERLLSIPSILIYENIMLILTTRIGIERVSNFLMEVASFDAGIDLSRVDLEIKEELRNKSVAQGFRSAAKTLKKNSRLPISEGFFVKIFE